MTEDENGVSVLNFLKSVGMKVAINLVAESWDEIKASTLSKSWRKVLSTQVPSQSKGEIKEGSEGADEHEDGSTQDDEEFVQEF